MKFCLSMRKVYVNSIRQDLLFNVAKKRKRRKRGGKTLLF